MEFLVEGIKSRKPTESVKNPGVNKTSPAITISKASSSSPEGILPSRRFSVFEIMFEVLAFEP